MNVSDKIKKYLDINGWKLENFTLKVVDCEDGEIYYVTPLGYENVRFGLLLGIKEDGTDFFHLDPRCLKVVETDSNTEAINNYMSGYRLTTGHKINCWHATATHLVFYVGEEEYRRPLAKIDGYKTKQAEVADGDN